MAFFQYLCDLFTKLILWIPFRRLCIFNNFTFTDAEDFGPLLLLVIGGILALLVGRFPRERTIPSVFVLLVALSVSPLLPNICLYLMAHEFQAVHGSWPQVMVDDPKHFYGHLSPRFDRLAQAVAYLEAYSGAATVVFAALFFAVRPYLSYMQRRWLLCLAALAVLVVVLDPGNLYAWFLD